MKRLERPPRDPKEPLVLALIAASGALGRAIGHAEGAQYDAADLIEMRRQIDEQVELLNRPPEGRTRSEPGPLTDGSGHEPFADED